MTMHYMAMDKDGKARRSKDSSGNALNSSKPAEEDKRSFASDASPCSDLLLTTRFMIYWIRPGESLTK